MAEGSMEEIRTNEQVMEAYLGHTGIGAGPRRVEKGAGPRRVEKAAGAHKAGGVAPS